MANSFFPMAQIYSRDYVQKRVNWLENNRRIKLSHITRFIEDPKNMKGNIENLIGCVQIPVGLAGPIKINGDRAKGIFYVPLATTEGTLVMVYHLGMNLISMSGGANTYILKDETHISPAFKVKDTIDAKRFINWTVKNFENIKKVSETTTKHGKLLYIEQTISNRMVIIRFTYFTGDAQGMNMINKATEMACNFISQKTGKRFILRSNFSSVKKVSMSNIHKGYGKSIFTDVVIKKSILKNKLNVTPKQMVDYFNSCLIASSYCGMVGMTAHIANGITAIYLACGQDAADISTSHIGITACELTEKGDLYASLYIPNLLVGTIGGGTGLATQRECLNILGCFGANKSKKFAEIVAASALAGEIAVTAALINGTYVESFEKYGRNPPEKNFQTST